ncbi:hypothetical protein [Bdellovibrio sp. HCB2-146]|uniref:hypothetical protein n=1 Tax=Bdellovibrio sp. HCB2-146 TaxID=3394362 RepID=UPI0039BC83BE
MNKKTIMGLLIVANLYGQMASANEVVVSEGRLQNISAAEISILISEGAVSIKGNKAVLNLQKLDSMLKDKAQLQKLAKEAQSSSARFVPYGNSLRADQLVEQKDLVNALSSRFVPYGNT